MPGGSAERRGAAGRDGGSGPGTGRTPPRALLRGLCSIAAFPGSTAARLLSGSRRRRSPRENRPRRRGAQPELADRAVASRNRSLACSAPAQTPGSQRAVWGRSPQRREETKPSLWFGGGIEKERERETHGGLGRLPEDAGCWRTTGWVGRAERTSPGSQGPLERLDPVSWEETLQLR